MIGAPLLYLAPPPLCARLVVHVCCGGNKDVVLVVVRPSMLPWLHLADIRRAPFDMRLGDMGRGVEVGVALRVRVGGGGAGRGRSRGVPLYYPGRTGVEARAAEWC